MLITTVYQTKCFRQETEVEMPPDHVMLFVLPGGKTIPCPAYNIVVGDRVKLVANDLPGMVVSIEE